MPKRRGFAFDIDNCLLNAAFYRYVQGAEEGYKNLQKQLSSLEEEAINSNNTEQLDAIYQEHLGKLTAIFYKVNRELIQLFNDNASEYASSDAYVFSNRQCYTDDLLNSYTNKSGSGFYYFNLICKAIDATPNYMLMADVFNKQPYGTAMEAIKQFVNPANEYDPKKIGEARKQQYKHLEWAHDKSKLIIAIWEMYEFALKYRNDSEKHDFYILDDNPEILNDLHSYLSKYPQMIPQNINLHIIGYEGPLKPDGTQNPELFNRYTPIAGEGSLDIDHIAYVKNIVAVTITKLGRTPGELSEPTQGRPIRDYLSAYQAGFQMGHLECVKHYLPGDKAVVDETPFIEPAASVAPAAAESSAQSKKSFLDRMGSSLLNLPNIVRSKNKEKEPEKGSKYKAKSFPTPPSESASNLLGKTNSLPTVISDPDYDVTQSDPLMPSQQPATSTHSEQPEANPGARQQFFKPSGRPAEQQAQTSILSQHRGGTPKSS